MNDIVQFKIGPFIVRGRYAELETYGLDWRSEGKTTAFKGEDRENLLTEEDNRIAHITNDEGYGAYYARAIVNRKLTLDRLKELTAEAEQKGLRLEVKTTLQGKEYIQVFKEEYRVLLGDKESQQNEMEIIRDVNDLVGRLIKEFEV